MVESIASLPVDCGVGARAVNSICDLRLDILLVPRVTIGALPLRCNFQLDLSGGKLVPIQPLFWEGLLLLLYGMFLRAIGGRVMLRVVLLEG